MLIRKGIKLLEETQGSGDVVQRQREYILSIRLTLNKGEVLACAPLSFRPDPAQKQHNDGFFDHRTRINRDWLIPGLFYAVEGMRIGGYRKVAISPHLAYGDKGVPEQIPANAKLIAEIKVQRAVDSGKARWQERETAEAGMLAQDELCRRYRITPRTLWCQRKAGRLPAPLVTGTTVRWKLSTLEQWEADDRPRVSPSFDEANEQKELACASLNRLMCAPLDCDAENAPDLSPAQQAKLAQLMREIDRHGEAMLDLVLELALLIDEAGQWHGPPLEKLLKDDDAARSQWRNLIDLVQKSLASTEP